MNEYEDGPAEENEKELENYYQRNFGMTEKEFNARAEEEEYNSIISTYARCAHGQCDY